MRKGAFDVNNLSLVALGAVLSFAFYLEVTSKQAAEKHYCDSKNTIYAYAGRSYPCPKHKEQ